MTSWRTPARTVAGVEELMPRLQARDVEIITVLGRHKVLTLVQIARLFFTSVSSARDRVNTLYELGVLRRFRPASTRAAYRYALSHLGTCLYLAEQGDERPMPSKRKHEDGFVRLMNSRKLAHTEAVNDFFTRLHADLRARYGALAGLLEWVHETTIFEYHGRELRPDGGGTLTINGVDTVSFWFEHDTGTEPQHVLLAKADRYRRLDSHYVRIVLFQLPGPKRQRHFHQALAKTDCWSTIATTITGPRADPADAVWWHLHKPRGELVRIDQLPPSQLPGPAVVSRPVHVEVRLRNTSAARKAALNGSRARFGVGSRSRSRIRPGVRRRTSSQVAPQQTRAGRYPDKPI